MSPRGESATPAKPNSNNGAAPAAPRTPLGPSTTNTHHHNNNFQQQALGQKSYKGYNTTAPFKPLFAGSAPTTNNTIVAPRTIPPSTPPRSLPAKKQQYTSGNDGGGDSLLLKSPQSSNYACLYERYKDITAPPYYPPPSPAKKTTTNLQAHSSGAPSILLKASKYVNLDTPSTGLSDDGGGAHPPSSVSYITELPPMCDHDADYSTGQSTTFSSRASSTSTRCDWNTSSSSAAAPARGTTFNNNMAQHRHVDDEGVCQYRGEQQQQSRYIHQYPPTPTPSYYATATPSTTTTTPTGPHMPSYSSSSQHHHHPTATILAPRHPSPPSSKQVGRRVFAGHHGEGVGGVGLPQMLVESLVAGEGVRKATTQPTFHQQLQRATTTATATSTASHHNQAALMELAGVGEVVAAAPPVMVEPFVSRPVWSLVGTFKTALQTALDARKGNALRWTQANPNGGRQKITIPFVNIAASEQIRLQMEDLQQQSYDDDEVKKSRRRGSRSRSVSVDSSSHHAGGGGSQRRSSSAGVPSGVIGVKRSRSETASFAKQDQLLARLPHFGGRRCSINDAANSNNSLVPPATQPHRMVPRPVSMTSHAVVIKTRNMRPSQVTFGFNSSIEAALFNTKIRNIQRASKEYVL